MAFAISFRMIGNKEDAEEVVQDSFLKAYRSLGKFRQDSKFSTWLYKIVVNTSISKMKKKSFFTSDLYCTEANEVTDLSIENVESTYTNLTRSEQNKYINLALEELVPEERLILTLYYLYESTISEIMEITGISQENIKMKLHRARKKMYLILERKLQSEVQYIL